jgi:hypothetical protein
VLVSVNTGVLHDEIEQLSIININDFHTHASRIFEDSQVKVIKKGKAIVTISLLETK